MHIFFAYLFYLSCISVMFIYLILSILSDLLCMFLFFNTPYMVYRVCLVYYICLVCHVSHAYLMLSRAILSMLYIYIYCFAICLIYFVYPIYLFFYLGHLVHLVYLVFLSVSIFLFILRSIYQPIYLAIDPFIYLSNYLCYLTIYHTFSDLCVSIACVVSYVALLTLSNPTCFCIFFLTLSILSCIFVLSCLYFLCLYLYLVYLVYLIFGIYPIFLFHLIRSCFVLSYLLSFLVLPSLLIHLSICF